MKSQKIIKIENAIVDNLVYILTNSHGQDYSFEGFLQETIDDYAFSKANEYEKYCIIRVGVKNKFQ